jgi:hypothetical protein
MQMDIWYISALCGSGKTHHLINRAYELAKSGHRVLVLQPTIELIERTIELELLTKPNHPKYKVFHRKKSGGSVASAISKHSKAGDELDGTIVFATHQVLPYIRYFAESSRWHVLMDEEMQVHACNQYVVPDTHSLLTDHLQLEPHKDVYSKITASDLEAIEDIARNKRKDQVLEQFRSAAQILRNDNYESYVNTKQYGELLVGPHKTLTIHSVLNPSVLAGFGSVTMASALFEDSMIYKLWSKMGVNFIEDAALTDDLLFTEHEKGSLVTIFYAEESTWSRNRRKSRIEDSETTILDEFVRAVAAKYEGREFLFQANRDVKDTIFGDNAKRIPNVPHGLNIFSHVHNIAFLSSLNPPPEHFRFMERCWEISGDELKRAVYCSTVYQAVMRGSIRDPNNEDDKIAIVPDRFVADYLHGVFPGSHVFRLDTDIPILIRGTPGRPRRFASVNERVAHHRREQARKELMDGILALDVPDLSQGMVEIDGNYVTKMVLMLIPIS